MGEEAKPLKTVRAAGLVVLGTAGVAVGFGFAVVGALRRNRPIHSVGTVVPGRLIIDAPGTTGSALFDSVGETPLIGRLSGSASWSVELPDIMGLAVRIPGGGHHGGEVDLLFASTGTGRLTRYILQLRTSSGTGPLTTMFPLTGVEGNIVFRLDPEPRNDYRLSYSRNSRPWQSLGRVSLEPSGEPTQRSNDPAGSDDLTLRFRPVANPPSGLTVPAWVRAVRAPAYKAAHLAWHA
ncbi:hypothetical protein [Nesterenkonia sp. CF4.4]|uniref:hypothetical protein n=1 Tax=Nesterenkonia sp. CF4.4 TaxID=3373079 RepID=UPI003EE6F2DC